MVEHEVVYRSEGNGSFICLPSMLGHASRYGFSSSRLEKVLGLHKPPAILPASPRAAREHPALGFALCHFVGHTVLPMQGHNCTSPEIVVDS